MGYRRRQIPALAPVTASASAVLHTAMMFVLLQVKEQSQRARSLAEHLAQAERLHTQTSEECTRLRSNAVDAQGAADTLRTQLQQARSQLQASQDDHISGTQARVSRPNSTDH